MARSWLTSIVLAGEFALIEYLRALIAEHIEIAFFDALEMRHLFLAVHFKELPPCFCCSRSEIPFRGLNVEVVDARFEDRHRVAGHTYAASTDWFAAGSAFDIPKTLPSSWIAVILVLIGICFAASVKALCSDQ